MDDMREVVKAIQDLKQALGASNQGSGLNTLISELVKAVNAQTVAVKAQTITFVPPPATSGSTGTPYQLAIDAGFIYWCYAANSWARVAAGPPW